MQQKVISLTNHKGGVGKTTTTINLGSSLARHGYNTLLIDLDPQSNLSLSLNVDGAENNIYGAIKDQYIMRPQKVTEHLWVEPAVLDLSGAEVELVNEMGRELVLRDLIRVLNESGQTFDFILIDCPPSLGLLTVNSFVCSHEVLIPLQSQYLSVKGVSKLMEVLGRVRKTFNPSLKLGGVLITQYDGRKVLNREISDSLRNDFGDVMFKTMIRTNVSLEECPSVGLDIFRYSPKSRGAEDYESLCVEFLERQGLPVNK